MHNIHYDLIKQYKDDGSLKLQMVEQGEGDDECRCVQFPLKNSNKLYLLHKPMLVVTHYLTIPKTVQDDADTKNFYQYIIVAKEVPGSGQVREFVFRFDEKNKPIVNSEKLSSEDTQTLCHYGLPVVEPVLALLLGKKIQFQEELEEDAPFRERLENEDPDAYARYLQEEMDRREEQKRQKQKLQTSLPQAPSLAPPSAPRLKPISMSKLTFSRDSMYLDFSSGSGRRSMKKSHTKKDAGGSVSLSEGSTTSYSNNNNVIKREREDSVFQRAIARSSQISPPPQIEIINSNAVDVTFDFDGVRKEEDKALQQAIILSLTTKSNESMVIDLFQTAWQDYQRHVTNSNANTTKDKAQQTKNQRNN